MTAPTSDEPLDALVLRVCGEVLGADRDDCDAGFFDLGGDSLLAVEVLGRLDRLSVQTSIVDLYTSASLVQFAASCRRGPRGPRPTHPAPATAPQ
ncbi:MAG: acyl carrier protein, partial [Frankia sp.]